MSDVLGPDEKNCPFCGAEIRAAAVKCPHCRSDLPVATDSEPEAPARFPAVGSAHDICDSAAEPDPGDRLAESPPSGVANRSALSGPVPNRLTTILLVLCLVLAAGIVALVLSARPDSLRTASNGQVTAESYRRAALSAAAANVATLLSYSYKTLGADDKAARGVITPEYAEEYATVMGVAGPKATRAKLTLKATVLATSLISLKEGTARLLVFANQITTADSSKQPLLNQDRLLVEMVRKDGDWFVSKLEPF